MTEQTSMDFLHPEHLADLRKSGLSDETILEAGIKSVSPIKAIQAEIDALKLKFVDINEQEKTTTKVNICRHGTIAADNLPCDPYIEFKEIDIDKINGVELVTKIRPIPMVTPIKTK